jgi:hypothetical protein
MKLTIDRNYNVAWSMLGEETVYAGRLGVEHAAENALVPVEYAARICVDEVIFTALKDGKLQPWDTLDLPHGNFALQVPPTNQRVAM